MLPPNAGDEDVELSAFTNDPASKVIFTMLRGVYPIAYEVHRGMKIESGRWPAGGTAEMVVGRKLAARFPNLAVVVLRSSVTSETEAS